ncbi:Protein CBG23780 [Caenorhabditis briggsae]|uniref:Protein CBG23780 n=1 Tax=Caenorhabditis briggsae TaxID=6238 RepID=A8WJ96_CAEBR|nr:Protein CBG23780 [Caenorhabditis briggsae]CAP20539.2 Protein CBG23780 [Caenorhabditis briggsae]
MQDVIESQSVANQTHWLENTADVSFIFSAGAVGAIIGLGPSVPLTTKYGVRNILSFYGLLTAFATLAFPLAVSIGYYPVIFVRMVQGFGASILFSAIGSISEGWSPISEISTYVAFLSAGFQISNIVLMPVSGVLCESQFGWRSIFYLFGGISVVSHLIFFTFFRDSAKVHRNVSHKELRKISTGRMETTGRQPVPYLAVCKDKVVLSIWAAAIGGNMSLMALMTYGPTYLNKVLGLDVRETGFLNAIPYILATAVKFVAGPLSDNLTFIPETWRMIFFAAISQLGLAIGFFVMALTSSRIIAQIAYTTAIVLAGINIVGVVKCAQMKTNQVNIKTLLGRLTRWPRNTTRKIVRKSFRKLFRNIVRKFSKIPVFEKHILVARQHVHFVMAVISLSAWGAIFVLPIIIGFVCPNHTASEWAVFYIAVGIWVIAMNIPFPFFATMEAAEYTKPEWEQKKKNTVAPEEKC